MRPFRPGFYLLLTTLNFNDLVPEQIPDSERLSMQFKLELGKVNSQKTPILIHTLRKIGLFSRQFIIHYTFYSSPMIKTLLTPFVFLLGLAGLNTSTAQKSRQNSFGPSKSEVKFLDDISFQVGAVPIVDGGSKVSINNSQAMAITEAPAGLSIENATKLQLKYAIHLDVEVELLQNLSLFEKIEEWYGTRYRWGGATKDGIDCSAFVQMMYSHVYHLSLPRTAREQYDSTQRIDLTELKEGDLVFFNTQGGVSHVGIYLHNNKFVHSATSGGVMISDLFESYWSKRYLGSGRLVKIDNPVPEISSL